MCLAYGAAQLIGGLLPLLGARLNQIHWVSPANAANPASMEKEEDGSNFDDLGGFNFHLWERRRRKERERKTTLYSQGGWGVLARAGSSAESAGARPDLAWPGG